MFLRMGVKTPAIAPHGRSLGPRQTQICGPARLGPRQPRRSAVGRPVTAAFSLTKQAETVRLPINFYTFLQINPNVSRDSINRAYNKCLSNPPDVGYSAQALAARSTILRGAIETLTAGGRHEYDERLRLGEISEDVPADFLAGALILLHEAGDFKTVVAAGEAWLATHQRHKSAADVALATALAHCDLATAHIDAQGSMVAAAAMLEVASKLLNTHRSAGSAAILASVASAAAEVRPKLAMELLSSEDTATRARGIKMLPEALEALVQRSEAAEDAARRRHQITRKGLVDGLRGLLSAEEQVALYAAAGDSFAATSAEMYNAAVAHIAAGCAGGDAQLVRRASALLERAAEGAALTSDSSETLDLSQAMLRNRKAADERNRLAVATSVSALLLGNSGAAGDALGLRDGRVKCDRQVLAYVKTYSPDAGNLLPGVCALAERWVCDVALASYRTAASEYAAVFTLDSWFASPKVLRELEGGETKGGGGEGSGGLVATLMAPLRALAGVFFAPEEKEELKAAVAAVQQESEQEEEGEENQYVMVPRMPAAASFPAVEEAAQPAAVEFNAAQPVEVKEEEGIAALEEAFAAYDDGVEEIFQTTAVQPSATRGARSSCFGATAYDDENPSEFLTQPVALDAITMLQGEDDWMARVLEPPPNRIKWGRVVAAAALLAGSAVLVARTSLPGLVSSGVLEKIAARVNSFAVAAPVAAKTASASSASARLITAGEASQVVAKWQKVKAAALGPEHALSELSSVLDGDLLQQWHGRAAALEAKGWSYTHELQSCDIDAVGPGVVPGTAAITASFREGVTVHKGEELIEGQAEPQAFVSEYTVVYQVARQAGGEWVLNGAQVQQTPAVAAAPAE